MKKKNKKKNFYQVNSKLYISLVIVFVLLVTISFIVMNVYASDEMIVTNISAVIGILGGAPASVIVAWLVDIANCRKQNSIIEAKYNERMKYLIMLIELLFQAFADALADDEKKDAAVWEVWINELFKYNFFKEEADFYERMLFIYCHLNSVIGEINLLNSGELKAYLMKDNSSILQELLILQNSCERLQNIIFNDSDENFEHVVFCIKDVVSTIIPLIKIGRKEYTPYKHKVQ